MVGIVKKGIAVLLVLLTVVICGCNSGVSITSDEFQAKMAAAGFEIIDAFDQFDGGDIEAAFIAANDDYQIEYYIVTTVEQAIAAFNENKNTFESAKAGSSSYVSVANLAYFFKNSRIIA
jgi:hypothetical protein